MPEFADLLRQETQRWLLPFVHYALKPNGLLVLGNAETIDGFTTLFSPLNRQARIYVRIPGQASLSLQEKRPFHEARTAVDPSTPPPAPAVHRPSYLVESIHAVLLDRFVPPGVFVNGQGQASISTVERATSSNRRRGRPVSKWWTLPGRTRRD